jgi:hypothetical protein
MHAFFSLSPCGRGRGPLRSNGKVRGLAPVVRTCGESPLTLPLRGSLPSHEGRGQFWLARHAVIPRATPPCTTLWHGLWPIQ